VSHHILALLSIYSDMQVSHHILALLSINSDLQMSHHIYIGFSFMNSNSGEQLYSTDTRG
jgi:hypothetical protein